MTKMRNRLKKEANTESREGKTKVELHRKQFNATWYHLKQKIKTHVSRYHCCVSLNFCKTLNFCFLLMFVSVLFYIKFSIRFGVWAHLQTGNSVIAQKVLVTFPSFVCVFFFFLFALPFLSDSLVRPFIIANVFGNAQFVPRTSHEPWLSCYYKVWPFFVDSQKHIWFLET